MKAFTSAGIGSAEHPGAFTPDNFLKQINIISKSHIQHFIRLVRQGSIWQRMSIQPPGCTTTLTPLFQRPYFAFTIDAPPYTGSAVASFKYFIILEVVVGRGSHDD